MAWGSPSCVARSPRLPPRSHLQTETLQPTGCWLRRRLRQETAPLAQEEPNHQHKTQRTGRLPGLTAPGTSEEATGPRRRPAPTRATLTAPAAAAVGKSERHEEAPQSSETPAPADRQGRPRRTSLVSRLHALTTLDTRRPSNQRGKPGPGGPALGGRQAGRRGDAGGSTETRRPAQPRGGGRQAREGARPARAGLLSTAWWTGDWRDEGRCGSRKSL